MVTVCIFIDRNIINNENTLEKNQVYYTTYK